MAISLSNLKRSMNNAYAGFTDDPISLGYTVANGYKNYLQGAVNLGKGGMIFVGSTSYSGKILGLTMAGKLPPSEGADGFTKAFAMMGRTFQSSFQMGILVNPNTLNRNLKIIFSNLPETSQEWSNGLAAALHNFTKSWQVSGIDLSGAPFSGPLN